MIFNEANIYSQYLFILLYILVVGISTLKVYKKTKSVIWILSYLVMTLIISISAYSGITKSNIIPIAPLLLVSAIVFAVLFSFSKSGKKVSIEFSITALLGLQAFRLPLEIILHNWGETGTIPLTMTWSGQNLDIIAGIICLLGIPFYKKSLKLTWLIQVLSFGLLLNVIRVAVMSSPFPFSWPLERPLQLIFHMPYALIVPGFVTIAFICHLLVFRKLINR